MRQGDQVTTLNGLQAWFSVRGAGPVCLFPTPGWGASSDLYFETLQPLERLFTVVYLDTRGCGRSQRSLSEADYALENLTSDLEQLRRLLGEDKVWVMGHSLGGLIAQLFAVEYPQSCRGLVLLNSSAAIDEDGAADTEARARRRSNEPWFPKAFEALKGDRDIQTDAEFKDHLAAILPFYFHDVTRFRASDFANETYAIEAYQTMTLNRDLLRRGALARLHELDMPAVIVVGDDDFICSPAQAQRIHRPLRGSKLVLIEDAGHFPWLEQPEAFYSHLESALREVGALTPEVFA